MISQLANRKNAGIAALRKDWFRFLLKKIRFLWIIYGIQFLHLKLLLILLQTWKFRLISWKVRNMKTEKWYVMRCAIWYHFYNLTNVKKTQGWVLLKPATLLKVTLFHGFCSHFLNLEMVPNRATHHI